MSATHAAAVNLNGIKALLDNGLSIFFINGNPDLSHGPRSLPRHLHDHTILGTWVLRILY